MLEFKVEIEGDKFPDLTKGQISVITRSVAARVRDVLKVNTPVGNRKGSGTTKRSWTGVKKAEGGYSFQNLAVQSLSLEFGSASGKRPWPSVGPRTVYNQGRIYSSQAPEGMTAKADIEKVASDVADQLLEKLIKGSSSK
jgi:hypothetical protein